MRCAHKEGRSAAPTTPNRPYPAVGRRRRRHALVPFSRSVRKPCQRRRTSIRRSGNGWSKNLASAAINHMISRSLPARVSIRPRPFFFRSPRFCRLRMNKVFTSTCIFFRQLRQVWRRYFERPPGMHGAEPNVPSGLLHMRRVQQRAGGGIVLRVGWKTVVRERLHGTLLLLLLLRTQRGRLVSFMMTDRF